MTAVATEIPRYRIWGCLSLPNDWVLENEDTGELFIMPVKIGDRGGFAARRPYRGSRSALAPVWGYNFISTGVPLRRDWKVVAVCREGRN